MTHPTKPIGSFYNEEEIRHVQQEKPHWIMREIEPGQFRRVVASPRPIRILEEQAIARLLARYLHAHKLIIVTDVERAAIRFGRPGQQWLGAITLQQAREYLAAGEFPPGSMGPKIEAAIDFVAQGGKECIITSTEHVARAVRGETGTHIVAS